MDCRVKPGNDEGRRTNKRTKEKEGSGTPTDAVSHVAVPAGPAARHEEVGSRRPSAAGALACRRSTYGVFLGASERSRPASGQASWDAAATISSLSGRYPPLPVPVQWHPRPATDYRRHDAQSRPGADRNSARGHRPRSGPQVYLPWASFTSKIESVCNVNSDNCQYNGDDSRTVMPAFVAGIPIELARLCQSNRDGRNKSGHDAANGEARGASEDVLNTLLHALSRVAKPAASNRTSRRRYAAADSDASACPASHGFHHSFSPRSRAMMLAEM
jgi:hypothetical protein